MRSIRRAAAPRVLVAAMTALAMAAGLAAGGEPSARASIRPACIWEPLSLVNGWQSAQNLWDTGDPSFCVSGGTVYLSGSLHQPASGPNEFAVLPSWALPASNDFLSVYTYEGTAGVLRIDTSGVMYAYNGKATQFTSLAGVSFPAAGTAMTPLTPLDNGWQSAQGLYGTGDPAYYTSGGGITHLSGSVTNGMPPNPDPAVFTGFATLPPGIAPFSTASASTTLCTAANIYAYRGDTATLNINPDGTVDADNWSNSADTFATLTGIAFPQNGTIFQNLTLTDPWFNGNACSNGGSNYPSYYVTNNVVYLSGGFGELAGQAGAKAAVLPPAARPAHDLYFLIPDGYDMGGYYSLHIAPDGAMWIYNTPSGQNVYTSIDDISYQRNS